MKTQERKENPVAGAADTAMKNYEQAIRTGLRLQEEASKWWTSVFNQGGYGQEWQKRMSDFTGVANHLMPIAQKRMEDVMGLMEKNSRTSAELFKKAVDAAQTPVLADSQAKWMELWTSSMGAVRNNTEAFSQISSKAIDSWIEFVRKNAEAPEARMAKAA